MNHTHQIAPVLTELRHFDPPTPRQIDTSARFTPAHDVQVLLELVAAMSETADGMALPPALIVEIGCNEGQTTADIARNFPHSMVIGIDLPGRGRMSPEQEGEAPSPDRIGIRAAGLPNVSIIRKPSWEICWEDLRDAADLRNEDGDPMAAHEMQRPILFFIDGDHSYGAVRADTLLCIDLLRRTQCWGALVWHDDYDNCPAWVGVRRYLSEQRMVEVVRVPDSWISFATVRPQA